MYKRQPLKQDLSIDIEKTRFQFSEAKPAVVVINAVSNVTGYVLPIKETIQEAKAAGAIVVVDEMCIRDRCDRSRGSC